MQNSQLVDAESSALIWILNNAKDWGIEFGLNQQLVEHFNIYLYTCHLKKLGYLAIGFGAYPRR